MRSIATVILLLFVSIGSAYEPIDEKPYILVSDTYPPYQYMEDGHIVGMDVEILEAMAKKAGITISIEFHPWKRSMAMAKNGDADGIFSIKHSKEREEIVYYPNVPLSSGVTRIFANNHFQGDITKITDLVGQRIGVASGNIYDDEFHNLKGHILDHSKGPDILMRKLAANRFLLAIENEAVAVYTVKKLKLKGIRALSYISSGDPHYIGISKNAGRAQHLLKIVSDTLLVMKQSGELEEIRNKYRGLF